jgi:hypothetical protein
MHEVDKKLQLVQTLEVRELRGIPGLNQRLETKPNERTHAPAQHGLLTEKIRLGLLAECRFNHASARATNPLRPSHRDLLGSPARILVNRNQTWHSAPRDKLPSHHRTEPFGATMITVYIAGRNNRAIENREPVREEQRLARAQERRDLTLINRRHIRIRQCQEDHIAALHSLRSPDDFQARFARSRSRLAVAA